MKTNIFNKLKTFFSANFKNFYYSTLLFLVMTIPLKVLAANTKTKITNPINAKSIDDLIKMILKIVIAIGTPVAVLFLIYSGFKFVMARGKPTELEDARKTFRWTLVGIAILLGASVLAAVIKGTVNQLGAGI